MADTEVRLRHLPFFEALSGLDDVSAEWDATTAGLVVLRLFDDWMESPVGPSSITVRAVREQIGLVDVRNGVRTLLQRAVDAMCEAKARRVGLVAPRLMAYARALEFNAKWKLAADVYRTVLRVLSMPADREIAIAANMQLGACLRVMADWREATKAYTTAEKIAERHGDIMNVLRARLAEANLAMDRGNLPFAETVLDETIARATASGEGHIRALALQDRGALARRRGDYVTAVRLGYAALAALENAIARDRALSDLAATFYAMGLRTAARDANLMLAATAQEQYTRWVATINLLELAAIDGNGPCFEQYRRELANSLLPAPLLAYYHYFLGQGYHQFDDQDRAKDSFQTAVRIAETNQLNEVAILAEQGLESLRTGRAATEAAHESMEPEVAEVANAIKDMRSVAGVEG